MNEVDSNNKADVTIKTFGRIYKMSVNEAKTAILNNKTALGIEFGSTRIKAVLVDDKYAPMIFIKVCRAVTATL